MQEVGGSIPPSSTNPYTNTRASSPSPGGLVLRVVHDGNRIRTARGYSRTTNGRETSFGYGHRADNCPLYSDTLMSMHCLVYGGIVSKVSDPGLANPQHEQSIANWQELRSFIAGLSEQSIARCIE